MGVLLPLLVLYLIKKLHQITAGDADEQSSVPLYLIKKLHQITARNRQRYARSSYILLRNYIKSQLVAFA